MVKEAEEYKEDDSKIKEQSELKYIAGPQFNMFEKTINNPQLASNVKDEQKKQGQIMDQKLKKLLPTKNG